jgi:glycosyltransferase involved in cell wall biosynthesis
VVILLKHQLGRRILNNKPIIDVIVPFFNSELFIERCIRSILNQNLDRNLFNVVFIDDGSTDGSKELVLKYLYEFKHSSLILNKHNIGLPASLNVGINKSDSKFIVRIDSDDYVNKNFISSLVNKIKDNEFDAIACDYFIVDDLENKISKENCMEKPIGCGIIFSRKNVIDIGMYNEKFLLHEDAEFRVRFLQKHSIGRIELPLYRYRKHKNNMTNNGERMAHFSMILDTKYEI